MASASRPRGGVLPFHARRPHQHSSSSRYRPVCFRVRHIVRGIECEGRPLLSPVAATRVDVRGSLLAHLILSLLLRPNLIFTSSESSHERHHLPKSPIRLRAFVRSARPPVARREQRARKPERLLIVSCQFDVRLCFRRCNDAFGTCGRPARFSASGAEFRSGSATLEASLVTSSVIRPIGLEGLRAQRNPGSLGWNARRLGEIGRAHV